MGSKKEKEKENGYRTVNRYLVLMKKGWDEEYFPVVQYRYVIVESDQYFFCKSRYTIECISKDDFCDITNSADANRVIKSHVSQLNKLHASRRDRVVKSVKRERENILRKLEEEV